MNYREGLQRLGLAALIGWEALYGYACLTAIQGWRDDQSYLADGPHRLSEVMLRSTPLMTRLLPTLIVMLAPIVLIPAAQWIIRGFTPPSAGQKPVAATSSTSGAIERAEANLDAIREEMADRKLAYH